MSRANVQSLRSAAPLPIEVAGALYRATFGAAAFALWLGSWEARRAGVHRAALAQDASRRVQSANAALHAWRRGAPWATVERVAAGYAGLAAWYASSTRPANTNR